jgi:ribosomal protein S21
MNKDNNRIRRQDKKVSKGGESINQSKHSPAVQARPLEVRVNNNFDKALRAFRALVQKERVLSLYKEKQTYEKPSDKRRRKHAEYLRNLRDHRNDRNDRDFSARHSE